MKLALYKAFFMTMAVTAFCVLFSYVVGEIRGLPAGPVGLTVSGVLPMITAFPSLSFIFIRNHQLQSAYSALEKAHNELQARSKIDFMTGLYNREAFFDIMKTIRSRIDTGALLLIDADRFKDINDKHGHAVGDRALKLIAYALQNVTRKGDIIGRIGGEEFCIYLPQAGRAAAISVAERVRVEVESTLFIAGDNKPITITISSGGALAHKEDSNSQVLSRADHCLYQAKSQGRNCVVFEPTKEAISEELPVTLTEVDSTTKWRQRA